jgi:plasmid maintenance system antidote protein VapI
MNLVSRYMWTWIRKRNCYVKKLMRNYMNKYGYTLDGLSLVIGVTPSSIEDILSDIIVTDDIYDRITRSLESR